MAEVPPDNVIRGDGYEVVFRLGDGDDPATVENVDATVVVRGGGHYAATFLTLDEIDRIMRRYETTGECLSGAYFSCVDLVIMRRPGVAGMAEAVADFAGSGGMPRHLTRLDLDEDEDEE
jgi:hypothetical protein